MDKTVYPAFQAVRESCRHPSEECMVLHRAISIVQSALRVTMEPTDSNLDEASPRIVLADIGYEVDALPTLLAEAAIANRTHCLQLGMNVPAKVIAGAIDSFDADVLWLSASGPCRRSKVLQDFETLLTRAKHKHVKVVVFGDALPLKLEKSVTRLTSFGEFRGFIAALGKSQRTNL
jgi:hypothetical protein